MLHRVDVKDHTSRVALLGDIVDSRSAPDRADLHRRLVATLARVDEVVPSRAGLRVTVGDEFQGVYDTLGGALDAGLRIRLGLQPDVDVRIGIGRGEVLDLDTTSGIQDGPGWWLAREAIEEVEAAARGTALRALRTAYRSVLEEPGSAPVVDAVNAALACRDHLMGSLTGRSLRLLQGLLDGDTTQADLAAREGISPSAVSQQVRTHGIGAILHAHDLLRRLP